MGKRMYKGEEGEGEPVVGVLVRNWRGWHADQGEPQTSYKKGNGSDSGVRMEMPAFEYSSLF